ncbi:hypothetical protein BDF20DRAFT_831534 [Mycotypha africana]|uniref:uncharacterized protein n=1 Tax=Mycotypha africana TaxID=64632 RepID=UPI002301FD5C|nr:uncharacterized protein BDF20DRAFT_831534 [Mycotypha africana]KAI8991500.1 hypothetical protein BDF20DRAFT_831534 [Mycotypha africana]
MMNHSGSQPQLFERTIDPKSSLSTSISTAAISSGGLRDKKSMSSQRASKSKVFQCTGFGDCKMVFTRSEHLARHMRKHTGEKPFQCIVPGCDRMFSRFDNMMQHTQTHNKSRPKRTKTGRLKRGGKKSAASARHGHSSDEYEEDYGGLPSPPPSRKSSMGNIMDEQQQRQYRNVRSSQFEYDDDDMDAASSADEDPTYRPPGYYKQHHHRHQQSYPPLPPSNPYSQQRIMNPPMDYYQHPLPPPPPPPPPYNNLSFSRFPDSPASSDSSSATAPNLNDFLPAPYRRRSAPQIRYQSFDRHYHHQQEAKEALPAIPRRNSVLSQLATYLVNNPDRTPESYLAEHAQQQQQQPSSSSPSSSAQSSTANTPTRRLSIHDLSNPIDSLNDEQNGYGVGHSGDNTSDGKNSNKSPTTTAVQEENEEETVQLTEDEYQAIKGFAQFRNSAYVCKK